MVRPWTPRIILVTHIMFYYFCVWMTHLFEDLVKAKDLLPRNPFIYARICLSFQSIPSALQMSMVVNESCIKNLCSRQRKLSGSSNNPNGKHAHVMTLMVSVFNLQKSEKLAKQNNKDICQICTHLSGFIRDRIVIAAFKRCLTSR